MLKVFQATDKLYSNNGDLVLQTIKAKVHKEDNGDFYINVEAPLSENEKSLPALAGTTVTGKNFTLNNVDRFKEVEITNIDGDTSQNGTPTPSTPQPINVVSGRQDIEVCKKNLYDTSKSVNGYVNNSGAVVLDYKNLLTDYIKLTSGSKYTISVNTTFENIGYAYFDSNKTYVSRLNNNNKQSITLTIPNNVNYIRIWFNKDGATDMTPTNILQYEPMVELGESRTTYEVYNGNTYEINLGKNLFTLQNISSGTNLGIERNVDNSKITLNGTSTGADGVIGRTSTGVMIPQGTYQLYINNTSGIVVTNSKAAAFYLRKPDGTQLVGVNVNRFTTENNSYSATLTFAEDTLLYVELYCNGAGYQFDNITLEIQLEKGTQSTNWVQYKTPIELCKIGDYQDKIYKENGKWYIEKKANKIASYNGETITTDYISTTGELTTGATIYYVLATPTTTEITDPELINQLNSLKLLEGLNNISITSADLVGTYTIHYNYREAQSTKINYIDYLVPNNIIVANTPQGDQAFRISNVENNRTKIKIKAYHVFYDSENYLIQDSYVVDKNCNDALDHLNNATSDLSPFTTISNINVIDSYRCVRKSLFQAIQVVIERWGGHLVRDNWTIGVYDTIGQDNGVTIRYAKNLKDITATYIWDDVVTKLLPVGKDGILLNELDPTASVYIESAVKYDIPYTKTISFEQNSIIEDDYKDENGTLILEDYKQALIDDLYAQAIEYITNNYLPKVNYTLSANVEKISDIGDTIEVIDEKLGINIMTNVISYDYDCILDKYIEIEFGNFTPELSNLMNSITENTERIVREENSTLAITLGRELEEATDKIWSALGNSYVIYDGDKILVVDSLPKETATNVIMINNGGIGFSNTGITGTFSSAWTIDNVLNMENINVINLTADLIKGGTLKLGSNLNQNGQIEVYDEANSLIAELNKNGLKMYGVDGSYVLMNNQVGFAGYDRNDNPIYWVNGDEFHMKKSVVEEEITLVNKMRIIPITIRDGNNQIVNDGIGFVNVAN